MLGHDLDYSTSITLFGTIRPIPIDAGHRYFWEPIFNSLFHCPLNPDVGTAEYLEDPLATVDAMRKHVEKLCLYIPTVVTVGLYDFGVPNLFVPQTTASNSLILHLVTLQLTYFLVGIEHGFSQEEIQYE